MGNMTPKKEVKEYTKKIVNFDDNYSWCNKLSDQRRIGPKGGSL